MSFVRSDFGRVADPYLSVETITYKADAVSQALPFWRDALAAARNETGTLAFGVYLDPTNKNLIHTLTAYESADYKENVHLKGAAAMALEANTKDLRVSITGHLLQKKGGFLYKGTPCA